MKVVSAAPPPPRLAEFASVLVDRIEQHRIECGQTAVNSFSGIQTCPSHSPFGMNGRALVVRIGRAF